MAEWVDVWAPVVLEALAEREAPETLVLDSTDFHWTNTRTKTRRREFAVLVAYGYTAEGKRRVWGIKASPTAKADDYIALLADLALPAAPRTIVSDKDEAIAAAVRRMWPAGSPDAPFAFACEHHLRLRAQEALAEDKADASRGRWMRRLDTAFRRPEGWEEFAAAAGELGVAAAWVAEHGPAIAAQVAVRHELPPHRSTAGAEAAAARLRKRFEARSFALRNARRTNLLLGLARLHLNNADDVETYHRIMREHAEANAGAAPRPQRAGRDSYAPGALRATPSLRIPAPASQPASAPAKATSRSASRASRPRTAGRAARGR